MSAFTCDYSGATAAPSPNYGERAGGRSPDIILLHYTGMATADGALKWLRAPESQVSCHYFVHEDGRVEQLVREKDRAWHAGKSSWQGEVDINSASIGIEIANPGNRPFAAAQMDTLELLLARIMARWSIGPEAVIGHSDMAPGRKIDPGPRFDWARLARHGLAIQPETLGADLPLAESLTAIGYPEADPETRLQAFRLRFRQGTTGPEDAVDRRLASAAATAFGAFY